AWPRQRRFTGGRESGSPQDAIPKARPITPRAGGGRKNQRQPAPKIVPGKIERLLRARRRRSAKGEEAWLAIITKDTPPQRRRMPKNRRIKASSPIPPCRS